MLVNTINQKIQEAMKAHDEVRLSTLRMLSSAFNYEKIEKQHDLTDEEESSVIRKQAKQRRDSIDSYNKAGATDRAEKENAELKILQEFLPSEMSDEEIAKLVDEAISSTGAKSMAEMGKVIGMVKGKAPSADGGKIAEMVKNRLGSG